MARWVKADGTSLDVTKLRQRWQAGLCVCCGGTLHGSRTKPKTLGEGVQICGFCHGDGHVTRPGEAEAVLRALVSP
jgi:hypothetical protein